MKINDTAKAPLKPDWTTEKANPERREGVSPSETSTTSDGASSSALAGGERRSFASVLEEVSRHEREQPEGEEDADTDRQESKSTSKASGQRVGREEEERDSDNSSGGQRGFGEARGGSFRELLATPDATSARAILNLADLERIVAAVRLQASAATNRREVVIELRRSVLEGLRVKLSTDAEGRVTAELIAASERVRSQLDARSGELAELMRSRGINLAALRTSTSADTSSQDSAKDAEARRAVEHSASAGRRSQTSSSPAPGETRAAEAVPDNADDAGATYRA